MENENGEKQSASTDTTAPPLTPAEKRNTTLRAPWKKGQSGNPKGRPKKGKTFSETARALMAAKKIDIIYSFPSDGKQKTKTLHIDSGKSVYHGLVAALISEGMKGNVQAIKELVDRAEGKAKEHIDHTTKGQAIRQPPLFLVDSEETAAEIQEFIDQENKNGANSQTD